MRQFAMACGVALLALGNGPARAQEIVDSPTADILSHLGLANQATEIGKWVAQLKAMEQQYETLQQQYQAVSHAVQGVTSIGSELQAPTLRNPMPDTGQLAGILDGSSIGPVSTLGNSLASVNRAIAPPGADVDGSAELSARQQGIAGVQAMAMQNLHAVQQRAQSLSEFISSIGDSKDVQQSAALQARLQLEQNYIAGQQAQAANLQTLAQAQQVVNQQRDELISRQSAISWRDSNAGSWGR